MPFNDSNKPGANKPYDPVLGALEPSSYLITDDKNGLILGIAIKANKSNLALLAGNRNPTAAFSSAVTEYLGKNGYAATLKFVETSTRAEKPRPKEKSDEFQFNFYFDEPRKDPHKYNLLALFKDINDLPNQLMDQENIPKKWKKKADQNRHLKLLENAELVPASSGIGYDAINVTARVSLLRSKTERVRFADAIREFLEAKGCGTITDISHFANPPVSDAPLHPDIPEFVFHFPLDVQSGFDESMMEEIHKSLMQISKQTQDTNIPKH